MATIALEAGEEVASIAESSSVGSKILSYGGIAATVGSGIDILKNYTQKIAHTAREAIDEVGAVGEDVYNSVEGVKAVREATDNLSESLDKATDHIGQYKLGGTENPVLYSHFTDIQPVAPPPPNAAPQVANNSPPTSVSSTNLIGTSV